MTGPLKTVAVDAATELHLLSPDPKVHQSRPRSFLLLSRLSNFVEQTFKPEFSRPFPSAFPLNPPPPQPPLPSVSLPSSIARSLARHGPFSLPLGGYRMEGGTQKCSTAKPAQEMGLADEGKQKCWLYLGFAESLKNTKKTLFLRSKRSFLFCG